MSCSIVVCDSRFLVAIYRQGNRSLISLQLATFTFHIHSSPSQGVPVFRQK